MLSLDERRGSNSITVTYPDLVEALFSEIPVKRSIVKALLP